MKVAMLLFAGSKKPAPKRKPAPKKKLVAKKKPVARTSGQTGARRAGQGRNAGDSGRVGANTFNQIKRAGFELNESRQNFGGQGIPTYGLVGAGIWVLLILRFTIFYGFFPDAADL